MAFEERDMQGFLFKNDRRNKDGDPHAQGYLTVDGRKLWVSAWTNDGAKGKYQKLSVKWADEAAQNIRQQADDVQPVDDDDLPF